MEGILRSIHLNDEAGLSDKAVQFPRVKHVSCKQYEKARNISFPNQIHDPMGRERQMQSPHLEMGRAFQVELSLGAGGIPFLKPEVTPQCFQMQQY